MNATLPTPRLTFDDPTHTYELVHDGGPIEPLPSVTTVLRTVGLINFDGVPGRILEGAQSRGTRVHKAAHYLTEGTLDWSSVAEEEKGYVEAAAAFLRDARFQVLAQEQRLYHPVFRIAGTCDMTGHWDDQPAVGDWKSGNASAVAAKYQLAWYALMLRAVPPLEWLDFTTTTPIVRVSIELKRTGTYKSEVYRDPHDTQVAVAALTVYRAIEAKGGLR